MSRKIRFLLNDQEEVIAERDGLLVLDILRFKKRLIGTKEGCREGDCGACVVLLGELNEERVVYKPVTSCLMPLGELHGKHLVTVEGLNMHILSPVQQAIVDEGGTQCGFCTPGIVVSLTGYLMEKGPGIDYPGLKKVLGGHLCRCTGYLSLKRACHLLERRVRGYFSSSEVKGPEGILEVLIKNKAIPEYFRTIPSRLKKIQEPTTEYIEETPEFIIAGGTDIYVQQGDRIPDSRVRVLNMDWRLKGISRKNGYLRLGALTTFEEFATHPAVKKIIPDIQEYMHLIASVQIRHRATLGGNIINASPIADITILLLALKSVLVLQNGRRKRTVPITEFFKGYKRLARRESEILAEVLLPIPVAGTKINFEKVSKRQCLDIASVNSAIKIRCKEGRFLDAGLAMGGVAPVPLFMKETSAFLKGRPLCHETVAQAILLAQREISPISDIRGSAEYKRLLVRQFLIAHFIKLFPKTFKVREFYEAH